MSQSHCPSVNIAVPSREALKKYVPITEPQGISTMYPCYTVRTRSLCAAVT